MMSLLSPPHPPTSGRIEIAMTDNPSLPALERLVAERRHAEAFQVVLDILQAIDRHAGRVDLVAAGAPYPGGSEEDAAIVFATRFAAAFGRLMTLPELEFGSERFERLMIHHRWIELLFSLSGFRNADNFIAMIATTSGNGQLSFASDNLLRMLALLTTNSFVKVDFDQFWKANLPAAAVAFYNYITSRYVFSPRAFDFRERMLQWLPAHLSEVKLSALMLSRMPEVYAHCSYAITEAKHAIKRPLMEQMRRLCLEAGIVEVAEPVAATRDGPPTIIVVGEWFEQGHAVFRTHSRAVQALRGRFHLVGLINPDPAGTSVAELFDECITFPAGDLLSRVRAAAADIAARQPTLIFYLGVGMMTAVVALASMRLAPIQCASFGHTATTMSPAIDYFVLPEDFVASVECFSEAVLALPKAAMPFAPRPHGPVQRRPSDGTIRVAVPASTMKLNPVLFEVIARIATGTKVHAEFHFLPLAATGLAYFELLRIVREKIPRAVVHPQLPHERYIERLAQCNLFLSPFPYGNMNSVVDAFELGLPGVCLDGREAHAHADAALFARIGLPGELTAASPDDYAAAAIRLIDDATWRLRCTAIVRTANLDAAFFRGDASLFRQTIENLIWPPAV